MKTGHQIIISLAIGLLIGYGFGRYHAKMRMPVKPVGPESLLSDAEKAVVAKVEEAGKLAKANGSKTELWNFSDYATNAHLSDAELVDFKSSVIKHGNIWK
jgi:hypothetical protein